MFVTPLKVPLAKTHNEDIKVILSQIRNRKMEITKETIQDIKEIGMSQRKKFSPNILRKRAIEEAISKIAWRSQKYNIFTKQIQ